MIEVCRAILGQFLEFAFGRFLGDAFGGGQQEGDGALLFAGFGFGRNAHVTTVAQNQASEAIRCH
jgi:hypothetical protein